MHPLIISYKVICGAYVIKEKIPLKKKEKKKELLFEEGKPTDLIIVFESKNDVLGGTLLGCENGKFSWKKCLKDLH